MSMRGLFLIGCLAVGGCGGDAKPQPFAIGTATVGPYRVVVTSPNPPLAGVPARYEITVFDGTTKVQDLGLELLIYRRSAGGPSAPVEKTTMDICPGCGAYRVDTTIEQPGTYLLSFGVPLPDEAKPKTLEFDVTLR